MKKRISGLLLVVCITLSMLPVAFASSSTIYVSSTGNDSNNGATEDTTVKTIDAALALAGDGDTIMIVNTADSTQPETNIPLYIEKEVTITGGTLTLNYAGIVLGADVTFDGVQLAFSNRVRNAIMANGHCLTLKDTVKSDTVKNTVHLFCGGVTGYAGFSGDAGSSGEILIQGCTALGNIYAGSISADGNANEWGKPSVITFDSGFTGSSGQIYACGALETYVSDNQMLNPDYVVPAPVASTEYYPATGGVTINLTNKTVVVDGATGGSSNAAVNYVAAGSNPAVHTLTHIGALTLSGTDPILMPKAGSSIASNASVSVPYGARLDLTNFTNTTAADNLTIGSLDGGGTLVLGSDQTLTITGAVTGTTGIELNTAGNCITAENSTADSFMIAGSFMKLTRGDNGVWTAEWLSIPVTDFTVTGATVSTAEKTANLPVSVTYADEEGSWDLDFATIDFIVTVNDVSVEYDDSENAYVDSVTGLSFYPSTVEEAFIVEHGTAFSEGSYTIAITVPAENTTSGEAITRTATITVTQATCNEHSGGTATCTEQATCGVCGTKYGDLDAGNHVSTTYTNGFRDCCGDYQAAVLNNDYYEISNAGQLYWFAAQVNGGNNSINGKLIADIVVNPGYTFNADGTVTYNGAAVAEGWRVWTPIGSDTAAYDGTFDGGSYTISGLYFNDSTADYVGLFGFVNTSGTVQNVGVVNSYFFGADDVGAIVGYNNGAVQNCFNTGTVSGSERVGGVVGTNNIDGDIINCYNTGAVSGIAKVGGVVGSNANGRIINCYNTGAVTGSLPAVGGVAGDAYSFIWNCYNIGTVVGCGNVGGVVGEYLDKLIPITNCYYRTGCAKDTNDEETPQNGIGSSTSDEGCAPKEDTAFSTGEVAYLLWKYDEDLIPDYDAVWGQTIGTENYPVFGGDQVYYGYTSCTPDAEMAYTNDENASDTRPNHTGGAATCTEQAACAVCGTKYGELNASNHASETYTNGFRDCCDEIESAVDSDGDGYYEISNAGQLYWFAQQVNGGNNSINGKLTRDIVVNEGVLTKSCELNGDGSSFRVWTPIGTSNDRYTGTFDGGSFTVSGLYFNDSDANEVGLFGYIGDAGAVHDLGVVNSYISGGNHVGGVVGYAIATVSVTNCYNSATVIGKDYVGGVVGNSAGPIANCYNSGTIRGTGTLGSVGGVVGQSFGTATNCHNTGDVTGSKFSVGGVVGTNSSGTVTNCYNGGAVSGSGNGVGGVAGSNTGSVTNCYNTGDVTGNNYYVGGVVGANSGSTVTNCYNTGSVTGSKYYVGGVVGNNYNSGTVTNCYYFTGCAKDGSDVVQFGIGSDTQGNTTADTEGVTTGRSDFSTGEVCYLLNGDQTSIVFKQTCGTGIPVFTGETVYYGYISCAASAEMVYTNNNGAAAEKPAHGNITYANKGSNHIWTCGICGDSGEEDHVHIDNKACICGKKITPVVTVTAASNLTYTGAAQNLVTAGSTTGGTLWYKVNDGEWSTTAPSATNADSYAVYYKVVGNENYEDVAAQSVTVTVTPMNVSGAAVTLGTALTYNGTAQIQSIASVTLNGLPLTAGDYTVTGNQQTGAGDYTLAITGKGNFTGTVTADWSIAKASMTITADNVTVIVGKAAPDVSALTYTVTGLVNGETADDALTKKPALSYAETPDTTQEGSYTINISGAEAANYTITYVTGTLTVSEKTAVTITVNIPANLVYDGTDQSDRIKANITAVDTATGEAVTVAGYQYQFSADPINAGSYTLTVSVVDSDEQYVGSVNVSFTIAKRSLTLKADDKSAYMNDSEPEYTFTVTGLVTGHSLSGAVAGCADADMTKAGTYDITISTAGLVIKNGETDVTANYAVTTEKGTLTVRKYNLPVIPTPTPDPEPEETVTVPVTDEDNTVEVEVTVTEGKATVEDVDLEDLEKVVDGNSNTVTIDFSELDEKITEVELPREVVEKIAETAGESEQTLEIVLSDGVSIEFNASALNEQVQQTGGISLTVSIVSHEDAKLTREQKTAVGDRPAYDISVTSDGKNISNMGGKITVTVPYELRNGEKPGGLVVYYVDDHGKRERCETRYDARNKRLSWQTDHLSLYMLDYDEKRVEACDGGEYCPINAFTDTDSKAWYHNGVHCCIENDLMNGISDDLFAPNGTTTRAQIVTILWRLEGKPVVNYLMQFSDVADDSWYAEAVRWAAAESIVGGYGSGKFGPNDPITREQMAAILYRYCQYKGIDVSVGEDTNILSYADAFSISEYAIPAMQWACGTGLIGGIADGDDLKLDPRGSAARAQVATILWRFCDTIIDN